MISRFERPDFLAFRFFPHTFAPITILHFMRKLIIMLVALLLPFSAFEMSADEENTSRKIPLELDCQ